MKYKAYETSSAQRRIYITHHLQENSILYNITVAQIIEGNLEIPRIEKAIERLMRRHEALRTSFADKDGKILQLVYDRIDIRLKYSKSLQNQGEIHEIIRDFIQPFDLSRPPLWNMELVEMENNKHLLLLDIHHIIADGMSVNIIFKELMIFYDEGELPPLDYQYVDFTIWQNDIFSSGEIKNQEEYWLNLFKGEIPLLNLPTDNPRPLEPGFTGATGGFELGEELSKRLRKLAARNNTTLYVVLLSAYMILLSKYSGQEDIIVGTPIAGRPHPELEMIVGMFVNTLVIRNKPVGDKLFSEFLEEVSGSVFSAFENQDIPFELLVEKLKVERQLNRNPLFDTMFSLQDISRNTRESGHVKPVGNLKMSFYPFENKAAKFDLELFAFEKGQQVTFELLYRTSLFGKETVARLIKHFVNILQAIPARPGEKIAGLEMLTPGEIEHLLYTLNETGAGNPVDKTLGQLFAGQVEKSPDHIALAELHESNHNTSYMSYMSYKELDQKSGRLAHFMQEKGVEPGAIVGIMSERTLEMITGLLGILKAGGAYLPIDPGYPEERINYMLKDSRAKVLLSELSEVSKVSREIEVIEMPSLIAAAREIEPTHLTHLTHPTQLSYIIYTSGTTGKPKGVMIEHRNVVRLVKDTNFIPLVEGERLLMTGTIGFDITTFEIWGSLVNGLRLYLVHKNTVMDAGKLKRVIKMNRVSIMHMIPQLFEQMAVADPGIFAGLTYFLVGGDLVRPRLINRLRNRYRELNILHMYGPTENTTFSTFLLIEKDYERTIPIGKPVRNSTVYILGKSRELLPIGVGGELYTGGAGVARGYLNNPELTAEKFISAHSSWLIADRREKQGAFESDDDSKELPMSYQLSAMSYIYRTGDMACWQPDGNLRFLGRIDTQVKLRGIRIELGEIEARLLTHPEIKEAVVQPVTNQNQSGDKHLCAYLVPVPTEPGKKIKIPGLREFMAKQLPGNMIPSYFVTLEKIPLSANGKVDRKLLPPPEESGLERGSEYIAPQTEIEKVLVETWESVLGREKIGIDDNYFSLGGDSIKAIQVAARMNKQGYRVELGDFFNNPTISRQAPLVKLAGRKADQSVIKGKLPLTPVQEAFFQAQKIEPHHFNQAVMLHIQEDFDEKAVRTVFTKIQEHHDALRMTYKKENDKILQYNQGTDHPLSLEVYDLCNCENLKETLEEKTNGIQTGINLENGPLMKLGLFHLPGGNRLLIVIHHLVIDGVSWRILFEDIDTLYRRNRNGEPLELPLKTDSFKVWSEKLSRYADSKTFLQEKTYWRGLALEAASVPGIKKDFENEDNYIKDAKSLSMSISEEETGLLLTKANGAFGTEINEILLSAVGISLKKCFAVEKILLALEGHGREEILKEVDIKRTIGWYTGIYPVIFDIGYDTDLSRQIKEVKESLRRIPAKGIGWGILENLTANEHKQDMNLKINPRISFNYLGQFDTEIQQVSFEIAKESPGIMVSPENRRDYELEISGIIANNRLTMTVTYNERQYETGTIRKLIDDIQTGLQRIISFCSTQKKRQLTPSDLTYKNLSIEELDALRKQYDLEDIYPLSAMQEGMLFHSLYKTGSIVYFMQISYRLHWELDITLVERSLNELIERYDILRTVFIHKGFDRPLQVVLANRRVEFYYEDIRGNLKTNHDKEKYIREFREKDSRRSFDLSRDVLMRVSILQVNRDEYEFTWSSHHILMDGWCLGIMTAEFLEIYRSNLANRPHGLKKPAQFRTYIKWLQERNEKEARNYWENCLAGYDEPVKPPGMRAVKTNRKESESMKFVYSINSERTAALDELAKQNQVTLSILFECIWAIVLGKFNRKQDVVFGTVVSGRPAEIEDVESILGLFINTIPVRIRFDKNTPFNTLLQIVREGAIRGEPYRYYPLARIQAGSILKDDMMNHLLSFNNYPLAEQLKGVLIGGEEDREEAKLNVSNVEVVDPNDYDFEVLVEPGKELIITLMYNGNVYHTGDVKKTATYIEEVMDQIIEDGSIKCREIEISDQLKTIDAEVYKNDSDEFGF
jgi:amino acid adenylation domain-containing protein/non-ribosomal peptide synthase protein (TIGR01720 family)